MDCGEGTQFQLLQFKIKSARISKIFISHLHGDHYFGLVGLLSSFNLAGRKEPLQLFGPPGLGDIISLQLKYSNSILQYALEYICVSTDTKKYIFEDDHIKIATFPLKHRVPCQGYSFEEKPAAYNLIKGKIPDDISLEEIKLLKKGQDVLITGTEQIKYKATEYTVKKHKENSYAYCSDTQFDPSIIPYLNSIETLYHEATFMDKDEARATKTFHSTASQAAQIAKNAQVKQLIIGHFSSRYKLLDDMEAEAKGIFTNTLMAYDGLEFSF